MAYYKFTIHSIDYSWSRSSLSRPKKEFDSWDPTDHDSNHGKKYKTLEAAKRGLKHYISMTRDIHDSDYRNYRAKITYYKVEETEIESHILEPERDENGQVLSN